jgi:O-antigen biosynthesis protein WbqP
LFDILTSLAALLWFAPLLGLVALVVFLDDGAPVVLKQQRVGRGNELFWIYKFRTMHRETRNDAQRSMKAQARFTRTGRFLRALSLDELPQLWNILRGDMSFVGPRPLIPEEDAIRRLRIDANVYSVLPGLTGWAQVNGRANVSDEEKVALDAEYLAKKSMILDIKILVKTVIQVLTRSDVE